MTAIPEFWLFTSLLFAGLFAIAVIDIRSHQILDVLSLPLVAAGLFFHWRMTGGLQLSAMGAGFGYVLLLLLEVVYERVRGRSGLDRGDAKLLAAGGAWCSFIGLPYIVVIASASGLVWALAMSLTGKGEGKGLQTKLPFGPFLSLGIAATFAAFYVLGV